MVDALEVWEEGGKGGGDAGGGGAFTILDTTSPPPPPSSLEGLPRNSSILCSTSSEEFHLLVVYVLERAGVHVACVHAPHGCFPYYSRKKVCQFPSGDTSCHACMPCTEI